MLDEYLLSMSIVVDALSKVTSHVMCHHVTYIWSEFLGESLEPRLQCIGLMRSCGSHMIMSHVRWEAEM